MKLPMTRLSLSKNEKGQALTALLVFIMMGLAIASAATFILISNSQASTSIQEGQIARQMADSGIETAYLKILRDVSTYSGETIGGLNGGNVVITVSWAGANATINAVATNGNYIKEVESIVTYSNNVLTQVSWREMN